MYANISKPFNVELDATDSELQGNEGYPRQTWWSRSVGPVVLTTALAPVALTAMGAGCLLLGATTAVLSVAKRLPKSAPAKQ